MPVDLSLGVVALVLGASIAASLLRPRRAGEPCILVDTPFARRHFLSDS